MKVATNKTMTYQIDCQPDGTIDVKQNDGIAPIGMLIDLPGSDVEVSISIEFIRNTYKRIFESDEVRIER